MADSDDTSANLAAVRSSYAAFAQHDLDGALAMMDDGILWHQAQGLPHGGTYHGVDAVRRVFHINTAYPPWRRMRANSARACARSNQ